MLYGWIYYVSGPNLTGLTRSVGILAERYEYALTGSVDYEPSMRSILLNFSY